MPIYAIIPARSGSKGISDKNIKLLGGHPLIAWSIMAARLSQKIDRVFVSTDSEDYARIARKYGAEVPFLRPPELSQDTSSDDEFIQHALHKWEELKYPRPNFLVFLRPTTPLREPAVIDQAIGKFISNDDCTSLASGSEMPESPVKSFKLNDDGTFSGFMGDEYLSLPRQQCPKAYVWDGYVDILRVEWLKKYPKDIYGPRRLAMITPPGVEIDTLEEFEYAEFLLNRTKHPLSDYLKQQD